MQSSRIHFVCYDDHCVRSGNQRAINSVIWLRDTTRWSPTNLSLTSFITHMRSLGKRSQEQQCNQTLVVCMTMTVLCSEKKDKNNCDLSSVSQLQHQYHHSSLDLSCLQLWVGERSVLLWVMAVREHVMESNFFLTY